MSYERLFTVFTDDDRDVAMESAERRMAEAQAEKGDLLTADEVLGIISAEYRGLHCAGYLRWTVQR